MRCRRGNLIVILLIGLLVVAAVGMVFFSNKPNTPNVDQSRNCHVCNGTGRVSGACAPCNGTGYRPGSNLPNPVTCAGCNGTGNASILCNNCGGTGRERKENKPM